MDYYLFILVVLILLGFAVIITLIKKKRHLEYIGLFHGQTDICPRCGNPGKEINREER